MNVVGLVEMIKMKISLKMVRSTYSTFPLFLLISCIFFFNQIILLITLFLTYFYSLFYFYLFYLWPLY